MATTNSDTSKSAATSKPVIATSKSAETTAELLKEERRAKRELLARLRVLESKSGVGVVKGIAGNQMNGFVDFIREQSVVGLAIGLVIGTQLKQLVDSIVANFISPILSLILPGEGALEKKSFVVHAFGKTSAPFGWGKVLLTFISFVAVAALVYALYKLLRLDRLAKKKDAPTAESPKTAKAKKEAKPNKAKSVKKSTK